MSMSIELAKVLLQVEEKLTEVREAL